MIPAKFDYIVAKSVNDAVELLGRHGSDAKILSGGHSLIPLMKFRLASPSVLIDVGRIEELRTIRREKGEIIIGAMTTYHDLESSSLMQKRCPLLAQSAAQVGDVQVRNRGTIGGSLVHADPASDMAASIIALDATMKVVGPGGERDIPAGNFFVDMLQSAVEPNEILTEIRVHPANSGNGAAYLKVAQSASGFAIVGVATALTLENGTCSDIRIGITGVGPTPFRASGVESALRGTSLDDATLRSACASAAADIDALSDVHASGEYRKGLAAVYARRSVETAVASAKA